MKNFLLSVAVTGFAFAVFLTPQVSAQTKPGAGQSTYTVPDPTVNGGTQSGTTQDPSRTVQLLVNSQVDKAQDAADFGEVSFSVWCAGTAATTLSMRLGITRMVTVTIPDGFDLNCEVSQTLTDEQKYYVETTAIGDSYDQLSDGRIFASIPSEADSAEFIVVNSFIDSDGDGYSNYQEDQEQTDPQDASSFPTQGAVLGVNTDADSTDLDEEGGAVLGLVATGDTHAVWAIILGALVVTTTAYVYTHRLTQFGTVEQITRPTARKER